MKEKDLMKVYNTVILPAVEYLSVVYHSLIPQYISDKLEAVQKLALSIIFANKSYKKLITDGTVELLSDRREKAVKDFAIKASMSDRFQKSWFPMANQTDRIVRISTREKYVPTLCRTERMRNNPVQYMIRQLNNMQ